VPFNVATVVLEFLKIIAAVFTVKLVAALSDIPDAGSVIDVPAMVGLLSFTADHVEPPVRVP
jgi:hypothetical protein